MTFLYRLQVSPSLTCLIVTGADLSVCKTIITNNLEYEIERENKIKLTGIKKEVTMSLRTSALNLLIGNQRIFFTLWTVTPL